MSSGAELRRTAAAVPLDDLIARGGRIADLYGRWLAVAA
jgi:hypothetical protein